MLRDWQVLEILNQVKPRETAQEVPSVLGIELRELVDEASRRLADGVNSFGFPFKVPELRPIACVWGTK